MKDNTKLLAIGVLAVTAVILVCAVVLMDRLPAVSPAYGDTSDHGGDYVMVAGNVVKGEQVVYVIDIATQELGVYAANVNSSRIDPVALYHLSKLPKK